MLELPESVMETRRTNWLVNKQTILTDMEEIKQAENSAFLFSGRALNFGILAIISSSSSAVLLTLTERTL